MVFVNFRMPLCLAVKTYLPKGVLLYRYYGISKQISDGLFDIPSIFRIKVILLHQ